MLKQENVGDDGYIPAEYQRIIQQTLDLHNDLQFGYAFNREQASYTELLGSRAYQRAMNRFEADRAREWKEKNNQT
jgi:hypothetical protein